MRGILTLIVLYVLIGVGIDVLQSQQGVPCDADEVHDVDSDEPAGPLKYVYWGPNLYHQVVENEVKFEDYLAPKSCIDNPHD